MFCNPRFKKTCIALAAFIALSSAKVHAIELLSGFGGNRGYGTESLLPNDDESSGRLSLPFEINFFSGVYNNFFVNNNGNISFESSLGSYTPNAFPVSNQPMIAPWWADVDTRPSALDSSNSVWVASPNANTLVVTWDKVGYYSNGTDKANDFQLVLRNRADTGTGNFDIDFRYHQLQWTTGSASEGVDGLGGVPAQAGYDAGDNTNFFTLPGSRTADVLNLQHTSNVSQETPGLWTFAVRNGALPGLSASNPYMPVVTQAGWNFVFNVTAGQRVYVDPVIAIGYDFILNSGPSFASVVLPNVGDGVYTLQLWNGTQWVNAQTNLLAGENYNFQNVNALGVDRFRVTGIEEANLDPTNTRAFVTGLTFTANGPVDMTQIALTAPEPETWAMLLAGLGLVASTTRRKKLRQLNG
ncbi:MAG: nidogen-like domain-containing protein [Pseudomonadota bacterium]